MLCLRLELYARRMSYFRLPSPRRGEEESNDLSRNGTRRLLGHHGLGPKIGAAHMTGRTTPEPRRQDSGLLGHKPFLVCVLSHSESSGLRGFPSRGGLRARGTRLDIFNGSLYLDALVCWASRIEQVPRRRMAGTARLGLNQERRICFPEKRNQSVGRAPVGHTTP